MDTGNVIRPLILEESSNDAETLASNLRNASFAVRYHHIEDNEDLQSALDKQAWDILLATSQVGDYRALDAVATIKRAGKDIPCIIFGPPVDNDSIVAMLKAGAADYINEEAQDHLLWVITREIDNLRERRAHRQCKSLYAESEKRNRVLLDSSRDPMAYLHEGMHVYVNQSYLDIFGYVDRDELESVPVMDMIAPDEQQKFKDILRTLSKGETPEGTQEFNVVHADGNEFQATMQFSPASVDGEPCTQVMIHQKSHDKELEKELQQLRQQDLLTGLFNHQHFMEELKASLASAMVNEGHGALLYLEPGDFKNIKDTLGIAGSDLVLADIAQLLRDNSPDDAILARYAGTVFTIILNNSHSTQAEQLAEQLRQALAEKIFDIEEKSVTTTFSIGIAPIHETTPDTKQALSHAEQACGIARERGGNQVHIFSEEDALAVLEADKKMIALLQLALKNNRFSLQYQPIVSLHAEPGERYEVLLRMLDPDNQLLMPGEFLDAAENAGLLIDIDRWVVRNAARALIDKRKLGKKLQFFIKLSSASLNDPGTLGSISKLLQAARLHGDSMVFEITEQAAVENLSTAKNFAAGLQQLHCKFALDHVGSAAQSLSYLNHLQVDFLKIDGNHIANVNNEDSQQVIQEVAELSRSKGFQTIAEHVQDPACLAVLWQHGVNFIQGYYLQHPEDNMDYDFSSTGG